MSRELKLALIVGFSLVLAVAVLVSDHWRTRGGNDLASLPGDDPGRMTTVGKLQDGKKDAWFTPANPLPETAPKPVRIDPPVGPMTDPKRNDSDKNSVSLLPEPKGPVATTLPDRDYTITEGDTLYKLAKQFYNDAGLHKALSDYNKLGDGRGLKVGAKIKLPDRTVLTGEALPYAGGAKPNSPAKADGTKPTNSDPQKAMETVMTYKVQSGDTLSSIARKVGCPIAKLMELNSSLRGREDSLSVGMELQVPKKK